LASLSSSRFPRASTSAVFGTDSFVRSIKWIHAHEHALAPDTMVEQRHPCEDDHGTER
jgi:hypothetical protein